MAVPGPHRYGPRTSRAARRCSAWIVHNDVALLLRLRTRWVRPRLNPFMKAITQLGSVWFMVWLCAAAWLARAVPGLRGHEWAWQAAPPLTWAVAGSHGIVQAVKHWAHRARPYWVADGFGPLTAPLRDYSFPSGHTTAAFAAAGVFALLFPAAAPLLLTLAAAVGISRMYLGHHFPSDVLAGALLGTVSALAACALAF